MESIKNILKRIECNTLLATKTVLTVDDVATLTGLSKSHIYKLTYSHQIPHYKPSGTYSGAYPFTFRQLIRV